MPQIIHLDSSAPLEAAKKNVEWAKELDQKYRSDLANYRANPNVLRRRTVQQDGYHYVVGRLNIEPPLSILFGPVGVVARLRAALDKLAGDIFTKSELPVKNASFPFGPETNSDEFPTGRWDSKAVGLPEGDRAFLLSWDAQKGGDETLWAINNIANADKHRTDLVQIKVELRQHHSIRVTGVGGTEYEGAPSIHHVPGVEPLRDFGIAKMNQIALENFYAKQDVRLVFQFGEVDGVIGQEICDVLSSQISIVEGVLSAAQDLFE